MGCVAVLCSVVLALPLPAPAVAGVVGPPAPSQPRFGLYEFRLLGNTVLDQATIERTLYRFLGPERSLDDVERARAALEAEYHERGYGTVFVDIPEQSVGTDGVVRLRVTEGRLNRSTISGERYSSERQIRAEVPAATAGTVPDLPQLQEQINAANAVLPDRTIVPVLKAGAVPGTVDLTLNVKDRLPLHGMLELNNQYTVDTVPLRAIGVLSYDNLFGRFDSLSAQFQTSPQDRSQVRVFAAAYSGRLGSTRDRLTFTFVNSSSSVPTVGTLGVIGNGQIYSARYVHVLDASATSIANLVLGADFKDFSEDVVVTGTSSVATPVRYTSLSANYGLSLRRPPRLWTWSTTLTVGLNGFGASAKEFADKCFGCRPNFIVLRMDGSLQQTLPHGFAAVVLLAGQYAPDPVISNEQFYIGGAQSVRGYYEAEYLGDIGIRGAFELHAPSVLPERWRVTVAPYVFYNDGRIKYQAPLPGLPGSSALRSFGAGINMGVLDFLSGSLTWADALVDGSRTRSGDERWEFAVRSTW
jgi:hemolysin activation/secretion protein